MADPRSNADDHDFPEQEEGGGESTVSMASPNVDPAVPSPISMPPPPMGAPSQMQVPTAPAPFIPGGPAAFPMQNRPAAGGPSVPTPFGGLTPSGPAVGPKPKPLPAAGAPPPLGVPGAAGAGIAGMKRPQTVIGLAPPPVGAPRPGAPGGQRVGLPSGRTASAPRMPAVRAPLGTPAEKGPPSSGRGVKPPSHPGPGGPPPSSNKDADATDEQLAITENETPDSQKEDQPTMAKSLGESLALFGLDSGLTDAARSAVVPKAGVPPPALRSPLATSQATNNPQRPPPPPPLQPPMPIPPPPENIANALPVLHDRTEEEESTRAVSREEMMRGHDPVVIGEDEGAQGEDATLAVAPGLNEANSKHLAALAETLTRDQSQPYDQQPPSQQQPFDPGFPQPQHQGYAQHGYPNHQGYPQANQQQGYPDPQYAQQAHANASQGYPQPQQPYAQSVTPQQPWQDPNAYPQANQGAWQQNQGYPGSVGPVSGPHLPVQPHFPGGNPHMPQSNPHLQVPQTGHMMAQQSHMPMQPQGGPIPYPGQPMLHQPQGQNAFGDWNGGAATVQRQKPPFKISGQILLLGVVGLVCLAIFVTGIVLFATTKF